MSWVRRLWYLAAVVGLLAAVAVLLGTVYGQPDLAVTDVDAASNEPMNTTANPCPEQIVRSVTVSVTLSRGGVEARNPEWWKVGYQVRASVFDAAKDRVVALRPDETRTVAIPFTAVRDDTWAPSERVTAVVQVTKSNHKLNQTTRVVALPAIPKNASCSG